MVNAKDWIRRASKLTKTMEAAAKEFRALSDEYTEARADAAANNSLKTAVDSAYTDLVTEKKKVANLQAGGRKTRRNMRGGGLREDALAYLKKEGKEPSQLLLELHKRNPNGSYTSTTKTMGGFTFKSDGHPAQSMSLKAKKENNANNKYENIFTYSDH